MNDVLDEQRELSESTWDAVPRWLRYANLFVGLPVWLLWTFHMFLESGATHDVLHNGLSGIFVVLVLLNLFFFGRAYWRMEI